MSTSRAALLALSLTALLAPPPARGAASEWAENEQSRVRLVTEYATAPRNGPIRLGLHFTLSPGWHVYWKNSGDAGFPPVITFSSTGGALQKAELFWPAPRRFELPGGLVAFGYEGEAVYPIQAKLQVPEGAGAVETVTSDLERAGGGESVEITAEVDYLVCEVDCIPYRYTLALTQPVGEEAVADPETSRLLDSWWARLPKPAGEIPGVQTGALVHAGNPEKLELEVRVRGARAKKGETDLFLETHEALETGKPQVRVTADEVVFRVPLRAKQAGKELPAKTVFAWTVTGLSREGELVSLEARREVEVSRKPGGGEPSAGAAPAGETGAAYRARLFRLLLLALLGGLLLNLMPTVLPLLLGELVVLRGDPGGRPAVREGAAAVATGILGSCMAMAALAEAARRAGLPAGWGAQLQEPLLAALILVAAVVLTLNLWGLLDTPLPSTDPADPAERRGSVRHLLAGLFTTPLALGWTLPLLREPVGFAVEKGPAVTLTVLAALGLGLSLPYLVLLLAPAVVRVLPAPGRWSRVLREGMGFLAGASTFWLLYALSHHVSPEGIAWVELALLVMALLAWLRHRTVPRNAVRFGLAVALVACAAAALWLADDNRLTPRTSRTADNQRNILTGG
ncbi:MAG TPA: protein-disulfide reductase DsbD domain-containing protein [Thermoanaerobaculia bacterium]|nr:protein-disulfide reductase DsbD domain-containing protein [Thermoanaerobaculia bacterium]